MDEGTPNTEHTDPPAGYEAPEVADVDNGGEPVATMALVTPIS
jgi:hypothetical protein